MEQFYAASEEECQEQSPDRPPQKAAGSAWSVRKQILASRSAAESDAARVDLSGKSTKELIELLRHRASYPSLCTRAHMEYFS